MSQITPLQAAQHVADYLLEGKTALAALRSLDMSMSSFYALINSDKRAAELYARAQELRGDVLVDEAIEIADTEGDSGTARNRIDIRKWTAARLNAKKWGERIDLNVSQTLDIAGTLALAQQRLRPISDLTNVEDAQVIDSSPIPLPRPNDKESVAPPTNAVPDIFD